MFVQLIQTINVFIKYPKDIGEDICAYAITFHGFEKHLICSRTIPEAVETDCASALFFQNKKDIGGILRKFSYSSKFGI